MLMLLLTQAHTYSELAREGSGTFAFSPFSIFRAVTMLSAGQLLIQASTTYM